MQGLRHERHTQPHGLPLGRAYPGCATWCAARACRACRAAGSGCRPVHHIPGGALVGAAGAWRLRGRPRSRVACASSWRSMCSSRECSATRHFGRMDWSCSQSPAYVFTMLQSYELGHPAHFSCASMSMCMPWAACWWHTSNATRRHAYGAHAQPQSGHSTRGACRWRQSHCAGGTTGMDGYTSLRHARQS